MKKVYYRQKLKQLKVLVYRTSYLLNQSFVCSKAELTKLRQKILSLLNELRFIYSPKELNRIIGASILFLFLSVPVNVLSQNFAPPQENPFGLSSTVRLAFPSFVDLDDDGDYDLLVGEADQNIFDYYVGNFQYFENTGTNTVPNFITPVENPFWLFPTDVRASLTTVDLDNDGDFDVFTGEAGGDMIYIENVGSASEPDFWAPEENPFGLTSTQFIAIPSFADLDNDGDFDLIVGEYYYDYSSYDPTGRFQYFENTGTAWSPQFANPVENPFGLNSIGPVAAPTFVDFDNDGDFDLMAGEYFSNFQNNSEDGRFKYFENIGTPEEAEFDEALTNPFGLESIHYYAFPTFADLDDDGDLDLLAGEYTGSMQYFENTEIVGIEDHFGPFTLSVFPNPSTSILNIESEMPIAKVELMDMLGKKIQVEKISSNQISVQKLNSGVYTLKVFLVDGQVGVRSIIKN